VNESTEKKGRVLVAMSGGVDSSVAASILVEQGYEVIGCTMQVWDYSQNSCETGEGNGTCCSSKDVDDARSVADYLNIPFYVLNCEAKFQEYVIDDFVATYLRGRTPIPCVNCNTYLKFDHLIKKMHELECDYLATGHYAQIVENSKGEPQIVTSEDGWKDQTYFLFTLKPEVVKHLMFPVGDWEKPKLRDFAEKMKLPVARKKDSTGICFIGKEGYKVFFAKHVSHSAFKAGELRLFPSGEKVGEHEGIHNFTYGQRKGLGVFAENPLYVVKIDESTHTVWLGEEETLYADKVVIKNTNWLDDFGDDESLRVKIRFHHKGGEAKIKNNGDGSYEINFDSPQRAITPGQAAVVYRDNQLLGGGWIL